MVDFLRSLSGRAAADAAAAGINFHPGTGNTNRCCQILPIPLPLLPKLSLTFKLQWYFFWTGLSNF